VSLVEKSIYNDTNECIYLKVNKIVLCNFNTLLPEIFQTLTFIYHHVAIKAIVIFDYLY
jgi:hypothetical protein